MATPPPPDRLYFVAGASVAADSRRFLRQRAKVAAATPPLNWSPSRVHGWTLVRGELLKTCMQYPKQSRWARRVITNENHAAFAVAALYSMVYLLMPLFVTADRAAEVLSQRGDGAAGESLAAARLQCFPPTCFPWTTPPSLPCALRAPMKRIRLRVSSSFQRHIVQWLARDVFGLFSSESGDSGSSVVVVSSSRVAEDVGQ